MALYHLLTDRIGIRILKILYDNEVLEKTSYTMKLSEVQIRLSLRAAPLSSVVQLGEHGLIASDAVNDDQIMSITEKGKEFIEVFDQLVDLFKPKIVEEKQVVRVKYELTGLEKKVLILTHRISKEAGTDFIAMKTLVREIYPYDQKGKTATVSRYVKKLEEIALVERKREGRNSFVKVTEKGLKTIKEQYLEELMR